MISKRMYNLLKKIPQFPKEVELDSLYDGTVSDLQAVKLLLTEARDEPYKYVFQDSPMGKVIPGSKFSLTENGRVAIEEYKQRKNESAKSTWAIVLAILSFIVSIIAPFVSPV